MSRKNVLCALPTLVVCIIGICTAAEVTSNTAMKVEESTVSPIADMAMVPDVKVTTERPSTKHEEKSNSADTQAHTVADFIIHPLIAFKPRTPADEVPAAAGRQSDAASTTTPSPWQIFGFNPGQGLGSLAGTVTGWINDRIQLPGLVDTPVRETTTTTSTTTTQRPDIVVRVQQRTTRRPFLSLNNRPNRFNNNFGFDSDEIEDEEYDYVPPRRFNRRRFQNNNDLDEEEEDSQEYFNNRRGSNQDEDEDGYNSQDVEDEEDEQSEEEEDDNEPIENFSQRPNNRRRPLRNNNNRRGSNNQNFRRRPQPQNDDDSDDNDFFYNNRPSMKRSQTQSNFIQRGQQSLINQIRQLTRVQSPAEVNTLLRQPLAAAAAVPITSNRQQGTLLVNRNGQTVYMAPELTATAAAPQYQLYANNVPLNLRAGQFPQPPLTKPLRMKGQPTQYITIPWNQLGISPPNRITKLATDLQTEPHILNIPQTAINAMQNPNRQSVRPVITAEAVPLLAEASLMDIFQPPQIPPSRSTIAGPSNIATKVSNTLPNAAVITAKATVPNIAATPIVVVPQRIRGGTLIEKAPALEKDIAAESNDKKGVAMAAETRNPENEYILVGEDGDPGLTRQVQPVFGDARYVKVSDVQPYFDVVPQRTRYGMRKNGRALAHPDDVEQSNGTHDEKTNMSEQQIPVEIVADKESESQPSHSEMEMRVAEQKVVEEGAAVSVPDNGDSSQIPAIKT